MRARPDAIWKDQNTIPLRKVEPTNLKPNGQTCLLQQLGCLQRLPNSDGKVGQTSAALFLQTLTRRL